MGAPEGAAMMIRGNARGNAGVIFLAAFLGATAIAAWAAVEIERQRARVGTPKPATPTIPSPKAEPAAKP